MGEKVISIYWFFVLLVIASLVVFIVYVLFGKPYNVQEMEASLLAYKVADCVSQGGVIPESIFSKSGEFLLNRGNFLEVCGLTLEVEDFKDWNDDQLFVSVSLDNSQGGFSVGNERLYNLYNSNTASLSLRGKNLPFCVKRNFFSNDLLGGFHSFYITACVRKVEKNV